MTLKADYQQNKPIVAWLLVVSALIFCMVVLGGVTRLTNSGLSMVEWEPIMGIIPPMNAGEWQESFDKYRQSPEYKKINIGMNIEQFKSIFYFEYAHRVLGRLIGLAFLLPFLYFLIRKKISRPMIPKMIIMFFLGGLQGLLGWYMVKSGLVHNPHVSQYRLTAHLVAAISIYAYIIWVAMGMVWDNSANTRTEGFNRLRFAGIMITTLILVMIISGGFVAGTKAGYAFSTFPLMNGQLIPDGLYSLSPLYINIFEDILTVQFNHRLVALALFLVIPVFWYFIQKSSLQTRTRQLAHGLIFMLGIQLSLGISTLLFHMPVPLAASHQAGALVLLTLSLLLNHELRRPVSATEP
jgi:cytochrome c oxidase assembly protein subunit 15